MDVGTWLRGGEDIAVIVLAQQFGFEHALGQFLDEQRHVLGELGELERDSAEHAGFCTEKKVEQIRLLARVHQAYARAMRAPIPDHISTLRQALDALKQSGGNIGRSIMMCNLAEAMLAAGDPGGAHAALQEGLAFVGQSGERYWLADLHRLSGHVVLRRREPDRACAESCFLQAIDVARKQEARLLELRAATDLGRLWQAMRTKHDIRALITPILGQIEGGATAPDVRSARALLYELV